MTIELSFKKKKKTNKRRIWTRMFPIPIGEFPFRNLIFISVTSGLTVKISSFQDCWQCLQIAIKSEPLHLVTKQKSVGWPWPEPDLPRLLFAPRVFSDIWPWIKMVKKMSVFSAKATRFGRQDSSFGLVRTIHWGFVNLSFLIYKMGMIRILPPRGCCDH